MRLSPLILLVSVTALLLAYGTSSWSWVAGPIASLFLWALDLKAREPSRPAAGRVGTEYADQAA